MGEVRVAGGTLLLAVRLHGVDVGAVEQRLIGVGVVAADPLDQIVLPHHGGGIFRLFRPPDGLGRHLQAEFHRRPAPRRVLHARQIGLRTGHDATAVAGC